MNNITMVIRTKNSSETLRQALNGLTEYKVIVVDKSNLIEQTCTENICVLYDNVTLMKQKSNGLAGARNEGLAKVKTKYIMFVGSDNVIRNSKSIELAILYMKTKEWIGCGLLTRLKTQETYFEKAMNMWWSVKIRKGEKEIIGTPYIYETKILKRYKYNDLGYSDDTDLCQRLRKDGHKIGYSGYYCYEIGKSKLKDIVNRFLNYGKGDRLYYEKYSFYFDDKDGCLITYRWSRKRKLKSRFHAFCEITPLLKANIQLRCKIYYLPFFIFISIIRFIGWFRK